VFVVPSAQLSRYEGEVAGLAHCPSLIQANDKLRRSGVSLNAGHLTPQAIQTI
jgi:hypothetical protein